MKKLILISALIIFTLISILPVLWTVLDSFIHNGNLSLDSYKVVLREARQQTLLANSLILAFGAGALALLLGVPFAFFVERTNIYFDKWLRYLCLAPLLIPPHIHAIAWIFLFGTKGRVNLLIQQFFATDAPFFTIYGMKGSILVLGLSYFPIVSILTISGLNTIDWSLEEAAAITSKGARVLRNITLPLVLPNVIAGTLFVLIFSLTNYGVPSLLRLNVYPVEIFAQFSAFYDNKGAIALSFPIIFITFFLIWLQRAYMKDRPYLTLGSRTKRPRKFNLGIWRVPATVFTALIIILSVMMPMSVLLMESGSLTAYQKALQTAHKQILTTLALAGAAATLATVLCFLLSYVLEKTNWRLNGWMELFSFIPFAVPAAVLGTSMIKVWNRPMIDFIYGSPMIVIFVYVARFSPLAIKSISATLRQIQTNMEEAATLSHASWIKTLGKVLIPLSMPGITAGWIIVFIFAMGELGATLLVVPPGMATLSIRIYTLMHYGAGNLVAALCLIMMVSTFIPIGIVVLLNKKFKLA